MYPEAFKSKEPEKKEPTIGGQAKEFFKGLAPGAINLVESAAIGASALLPEETEKAARSGIASLASSAKKPFEAGAGYEDTVGRKFGEAAGSIIPFIGLGPLGLAGRVGMGALGAGAGAGEARTRAEAGGATEGQRAGATALGSVVGISEMFAPARILGRVSEPVKDGAVAYVKRALLAGGEEAAQEAASQAAQNLISKGIYKPDQEIIEGVGESAAYGGAVGALAQGLFDMALGRRAKSTTKPQDEYATLRAEEEKRLEAERQYKATPEYAQEVVQKYDVLAKQKQDLIAQIKKIEKTSPTADADRAFNKDINAQIKELSKELEPLADDYYKSKGMLTQMAEQERVAKLSPQEYAFGVAPETDEQKAQALAKGPELYEQQIATPPKPTAALTPRQQVAEYADQRVALANDQMNTAASFTPKFKTEAKNDYVNYLMQDFSKAQQLVQTRPTLTGLPEGLRSEEIFDALKLRVGAEAKAATQQRAQEQAFDQQKLTQPKDQMAMFKESEAQVEEQKRDAEPNFAYLDPMFEKALAGQPGAVKVNEKLKPLREAPTVRKTVEQLLDTAEQANKEHWMFRRQGNRAAAIEAAKRRNTATDQLNAMSAEKPAGVDTKGLKRGPAEEDTRASYARELIAARRGQQEAMAKLEDAASGVRSEQTLGRDITGANTEAGLVKRAEEARADYIKAALQEAAIHRRAAGTPALTTDEALIAASKLHDTLGNWIGRAQEKGAAPEYEDVIVQPAQMRADKVVRPAVTERRLVKGGVKKLSEAEVKHFKAIAESVRNKLSEEAPTKVQRVEAGPLKRQFATEEAKKTAEAKGETATTLGGQLRRRKEYVTNLLDRALALKNLPEGGTFEYKDVDGRTSVVQVKGMRETLERAKEMIEDGVADTRLLDAAENQAERVLRGQDLGQVTRMGREQIAEGRQVVRNVPGKEGSTEIGRRGQKFVTTGKLEAAEQEKATFPKGAPVAVEANEALRELEEAIALNERVAQEKAGQKSLFPEIEEDLGYIRATPANFAKSPRMRPVWEALDKARALFKKSEQERLVRKATVTKRMQFLERVKERGDSIIADTQYFWKDTSRYSDEMLAKVFVGMPEAGTTPEEKVILEKYRTLQPMSAQEQLIAERLVREFKTEHLPKYRNQIDEAMRLLADGRRLDDTDNQLLSFMQDTNANVRAAAKALNDRLQPLRTAIKQVKKAMQGSVVISAEQKAILNSEKAIKQQRGTYQQAVEKAVTNARREMDDAMAFLLDPVVSKASADLEKAKTTLDKEQAELDKIKKRFDSVLAQEDGANRTELATYELFRYEEKKGIIDDLKKQVETQEDELTDLVNERSTEHDGGYAVAQAMLDGNVKMERQYLEMLEANLATMRGESVLDKPSSYPFAYQQTKKNADAQRATLKAAEKRATEFKEQAKTEQQKLEDFWKDKLGGEGIKREEGKVERIKTTAEKEADKLREESIAALDREERAAEREALKEQILKTYADQLGDLLIEADAIPGPNTEAELKKIINDPKSELDDVINAQAKVSVLQAIASVEAQEEVFLEGKPAKKQKAATTLSSVGQAKGKPLRTGRMTDAKLEKLFKPTAKVKALEDVYFEEADQGGIDIDQYGDGKTQGSFDFSGDINFSRGESTTGTDAKTLKAELDEAMGGDVTARGNVKIYNSVEAFVKQNPEYADKIPSDAKGFAEEGSATLFANNIGKGHGLGVLLHEVGVHIGFRNFFNQAQFNRLVSTVKGWAARTDNSLEAQIGRKAMQRVEMAETTEEQVDDELLAYAVEEAVQAGVMQTRKGPLFGWLSSIIDAFKKALNKLGFPTSKITAGDLVNFAYGCAQLELRGTWHGTGGVFDQFDFAFMGAGEGAQAFSWGTYRAQRSGVAEYYQRTEAKKRLNEWAELPEIKKWQEGQQAPTFNGHTAKDFFAFAAPKNKDTDKTLGGVPYKYAHSMFAVIRTMGSPTFESKYDSDLTGPVNLFKEVAKDIRGFDKSFLKFVDGLDLSKLSIHHVEPTYKGMLFHEVYSTKGKAEGRIAGGILNALQKTEGSSFEERLNTVLDKERKQSLEIKDLFSDEKTGSMYKHATETLAFLDNLDKNNFVFNPPVAPPIPKPTGALMRTVHLAPEDTYLRWNEAADAQPEPVDKAVREIFNDLSETAQIKFLSLLPETKPAKGMDIYNALSGTLESERAASLLMYNYGIAGNKFLDSFSRGKPITKKSTYNYVDFADKEQGAQIVATNIAPVGNAKGILLSRKPQFADPEFERVSSTITKTVAQDRTWMDSIKANFTGLAFETQLVDRFAGFERLAKYMEPLKGTQMLYYLRSYDQRMNIVSKSVSDGAPAVREVTRDDGRVERLVETTGGASIAGVVDKLKDAKQYIGNGEAVNQVFTTYMAAIRAKNKGIETLNFGTDKDGKPVLTQVMLDEVTALVENNKPLEKIFNEARTEYNKYNRDLLDFVASTGALSKALVKKLVAEDDYIPFYRQRKGVVELVIGNESPIRIGSISEQPYLDKLVGGDTAILDFMTSSVQNTNMLVDMGMRNLATKNAVMELVDLKAATLVKKADGADVVKFKVDGDDRYAIVATEKIMIGNKEFETGIPADILVKGMEGIPTQMPFLFRVMAMPAQVLRKAVTLSPLYMAKQLFRDSLAAPILSGADFVPVLGALKEINGAAKETLEKRGITGGQYFRGTSEDLSMILREITDGQPGWMKALGKFEAMGMEADAITRRAQYNSYIEQGLSEMEATLMALESMNFNKRGASPSIHVANALIPFFNAQIQGLNVMYKAMSGKMPFNDQLRIREKMLTRGGMMAAATIVYAAMMEDDEAYKNATPDQKYGSWFVRLPGFDEPVRIPVPFEIGYVFKAIPEALYNSMTTEHGGEEAVKAFKQILLQTVPGGSSYGIPQAAKPLIEVGLGKSFYTGRDILSAREKQLLPEEQYRVNTSEAAKLVGSTLGISPIKIEALVNGYTGTMGLAFLQAISLGVPSKETPEQAVKRLSEYPIIGGVFQPNDAGGIINSVYERMNEVSQVKSTVDKLLQEGKVQEAEALITKRGTDYMQSELANTFKTNMNMLTQAERAVAASKMSPEEKRKQLDDIRKMKIGLANATREISDKTIRLVGSS
jgi:hypothetical protein